MRVNEGRKVFMKKTVRQIIGAFPLVFVGFFLILTACAGSPAQQQRSARDLAIEAALPIRTSAAQRPEWIDTVPQVTNVLNFVGTSLRYATEAQARDNAQENGRRQLVDYYGTVMSNKAREYTATFGISSDVFSPQIAGQQLNQRIAENIAQALGARSFYTEVFLDDTNREAFTVYVLMEIEKARVANVLADVGQETAANLARQAAEEQDAARRQQMEKAAEFFGGNLSSSLF
jgi:hypothetical protein